MRTITVGVCALALAITAATVCACPTVLNVMPTADVVPEGSYTLQAEGVSEGGRFDEDSTWSILTQVGGWRDVELGLDLLDAGNESDWTFDAKWRVVREAPDRPALALGLLNINQGGDRGYYLTGARSVMDAGVRLHGGVLHLNDSTSGMVGAEGEILPGTTVLADWITGPDGTLGIGVARSIEADYVAQLFYLVPNTSRGAEEAVGLNLCWQSPW
jgi:hypothetical protein